MLGILYSFEKSKQSLDDDHLDSVSELLHAVHGKPRVHVALQQIVKNIRAKIWAMAKTNF